LLSAELDGFLAGSRDFDLLFEPSERTSLAGVAIARNSVILEILENVRSRIQILKLEKGEWQRSSLDLPEYGSVGVVIADNQSDVWFYTYSDFLQPSTLFAVEGGRSRKVKQLPEFFKAEGLTVQQLEATSADGTRVPYFLVSPRGMKLDGSQPTLLYGYGGFEIAQTPNYSAVMGASWLEQGGAYALANIRGGGEFGARWHQAALLKNRHKAFEDFMAVAEDLIRRGITSPDRLGIQGGSNGGLLVGSVFTRRPDLFGAVVCQVPLLDMKRYHRLLAGASWMAEYGNPDDPDMWAYLRTYSPYHNVSAGVRYPRVLFMTSTRDDRVHPGHARKMVARMRQLGHPVMYYENTEGGHAAAANNRQRAYMSALAYTYLWRQLGGSEKALRPAHGSGTVVRSTAGD
jgi:prolyl oligopeptidase